MRINLNLLAGVSAILASTAVLAGPLGDYGDAPVGDIPQGIQAYPGVLARWDTRFNHTDTIHAPLFSNGAWLNPYDGCYLGTVPPPSQFDSAMNPTSPDNDCVPVILVWDNALAIGQNPLAEMEVTVTTTASHDPTRPVYVNVWIDQNRDGQWKDGYSANLGKGLIAWNLEWAVQDVPVVQAAGTTARVHMGPIRLENPLASVWIRVMVTDEPVGNAHRGPAGSASWFWDSTMNFAHAYHGEIEDHLLNFQTNAPAGVAIPGIWYRSVYKQIPGGGGGGGAKPSCSVKYEGPWVKYPPACPAVETFTLNYGYLSVNNGCQNNPVMWGMYGLKHLAGIMAPPTVTVHQPLPPGAVLNPPAYTCLPPAVGVLSLPAAIVDEGPLMASVLIPITRLADPPQLQLDACYGIPPKRYRSYRVFFHTQTCGSVHVDRTVYDYGETGITLASAVVSGPGQSSDYCDFITGGIEENFQDVEESRPYPDPDFGNPLITPITPTGFAVLDGSTFHSAPTCLLLQGSRYWVQPIFPIVTEAADVSVWHQGSAAQLFMYDAHGDIWAQTLPPSFGWTQTTFSMPPRYQLRIVEFISNGTTRIDDLKMNLREAATLPAMSAQPAAMTVCAGETATLLGDFFNPGSEPFDGSWWFYSASLNHWFPLHDGVMPGGMLVSGSGSLALTLQSIGPIEPLDEVIRLRCVAEVEGGLLASNECVITLTGSHCQPADIAYDTGAPLPPWGPCTPGESNTGVNEGDYNAFFQGFFDAFGQCDIANDDGSPRPPFGPILTNTGVNEGDYNCFFQFFFLGCP